MAEMDVELFFIEQDKRMNMPDEGIDEYLNRMNTWKTTVQTPTRRLTDLLPPLLDKTMSMTSIKANGPANPRRAHVEPGVVEGGDEQPSEGIHPEIPDLPSCTDPHTSWKLASRWSFSAP